MQAMIEQMKDLVQQGQNKVLSCEQLRLLKEYQRKIQLLSHDLNPEEIVSFVIDYYFQMEFSDNELNKKVIQELESKLSL